MTRALNLAPLPGSGRETATYGAAGRWPMRSPLPSLDPADYEDGVDGVRAAVLDLAANALHHLDDRAALGESSDHLHAVLLQVEAFDVETRTLEEQVVTLQRQLAVAQGVAAKQIQSLGDLYHAELTERVRLQAGNAVLANQLDAERREVMRLAFELATRTITKQPFDAVNAHLDSECETHVIDVDGLDGPPPDRTPTLQDVPRTMAMVVGGGL